MCCFYFWVHAYVGCFMTGTKQKVEEAGQLICHMIFVCMLTACTLKMWLHISNKFGFHDLVRDPSFNCIVMFVSKTISQKFTTMHLEATKKDLKLIALTTCLGVILNRQIII